MFVGGRRVVMNEVLFVPDGEVVTFDCNVLTKESLKVRMEFLQDPVINPLDKPDARLVTEYEMTGENIACLVLKFFNFNKISGQSLKSPQVVANVTSTGEEVTFLASVQKMGELSKIDFQFMAARP